MDLVTGRDGTPFLVTRILVTKALPKSVLNLLGERFEVIHADPLKLDRDAFIAALDGVEGIVPSPGDPFDTDMIDALPESVRILACYSVGLNHVDAAAAERRGIRVSNTPDVLTDATADTAILLILGAVRGAGDATRLLLSGEWTGWAPAQIFGRDLAGLRLGIFGPGRIGVATAQRARVFGMSLHYWSGRRVSTDLDAMGADAISDMDDFLAASDVLSLHCPLTPETERFINADRIDRLPNRAVIINTGRGGLVDDDALIAAVRSGKVGAIGLDVFEGEPRLDPRYLTLPRAFLLPHIGSATEGTRLAMGRLVETALRNALFQSE